MRSLWTFLFVVLLFAPGVNAQGIISTVAGNGTATFGGDGGAATGASLSFPFGVAVDTAGNLFIADRGNVRVRRVDAATGIITTVAGNGVFGFSGDGGPATSATLDSPSGVTLDAAGNLFIADSANQRIRRVDAGADGLVTGAADETITTVAGSGPTGFGSGGFSGDGGPATSARFATPTGVALDAAGNLFIADTLNHRIRRVQAPVTAVDIDIKPGSKPGSNPNAVNPTNRGLVPVAILTTDTFDATAVSPITVQFGPAGASLEHQLGHLEDVDGDGDLDLVLHFRTQGMGIQCGDTEASLTGETFDGQPIQGSDSIVTVGCN